ncbi:MAG: hypothetical protein ACYC69_01095 [Thermodesulfovibrionales bacterium]
MKYRKAILIVIGAVLLSGAMYLLAQYGIETFISDAATRLAYQIRDEAAALRRSGQATRTFAHLPRKRPEGVTGDYRIEITETRTSPRPGHRSIGVAMDWKKPTWYATSYHLNFVEVPEDLIVLHRKGEATIVTLEMKDGKVLLTGLQ